MLIDRISALIPSAMKSGDKVRLNTLRDIKKALFNAQVAVSKEYELSKEEEDKIILKMIATMEDAIEQFQANNRKDLVDEYSAQLAVIKEFAPKVASEEDITTLTQSIIIDYMNEKGEDYKLSMRDMTPILNEVKKTYPTANGGVVSKVLRNAIG